MPMEVPIIPAMSSTGTGKERDETYVLNLCDRLLRRVGRRQHRFDFLCGDTGTKLPCDAFYPTLNLVIEYRERQHFEPVAFFDKRSTVSGCSRGEQRKRYDRRRRVVLRRHGIRLVELTCTDFECDGRRRLRRLTKLDRAVLRAKLADFLQRRPRVSPWHRCASYIPAESAKIARNDSNCGSAACRSDRQASARSAVAA